MTLTNEMRTDAERLLRLRHCGKVKELAYEPYVLYRDAGGIAYALLSSAQNISTDTIIEFVDLPR